MTKARDLANGGFGLVLVKPSSVVGGTDNGKGTVTFSASSAVSLNDVFSSTYQNYRIILQSTNTSAAAIRMRLRVSNADSTANSYGTGYYYKQLGGAGVGSISDGFTTSWTVQQDSAQSASNVTIDIFRPFEVTSTFTHFFNNTTDNIHAIYLGGNVFNASTSFTGFTIYPASSSISGTVSVYGYNK